MFSDAETVMKILKEQYPDAGPELNFSNPYETLVATILSAQCTDKRVNMVTPALFRDYPDVGSMAEADPETIYEYVRSCGFRSKAVNIVNACRQIRDRFGGNVPRTLEELTLLPGVGRKTASVVLLAAFHIPAMPVDTHVFRVSNRIGLAEASTVENTEKQLRALLPEESWFFAHHALILHGRRVCHSKKPDCGSCPLKEYCAYHKKQNI